MSIESANKNIIHRAYYCADCEDFLKATVAEIHDEIVQHSMTFDLTAQQNIAWNEEIRISYQLHERRLLCAYGFHGRGNCSCRNQPSNAYHG